MVKPVIAHPKSKIFICYAENNVRLINAEIHGAIYIGFASYINSGTIRSYCEIGRYCSIGRDVAIGLGHHDHSLFTTSPHFKLPQTKSTLPLAQESPKRRVVIGHDVWIGDGVKIMSGITIGNGAILATGSVITKDVAPYSIVGGIPAKAIRNRFSDSVIDELQKSNWWELHPDVIQSCASENIDTFLKNIKKLPTAKKAIFPVNYEKFQYTDIEKE